jgi:glycogen(starch) synthase
LKILLGSHHFPPSIGGIETVSDLLAREFVKLGHDVRVITQTLGESSNFPFRVIHKPGPIELFRQIAWCNVFLQNNISLRTLWPLLFLRRPFFVTHQTWIVGPNGRVGWPQRLKRLVLRFAKSFAISEAVAAQLPVPSVRVGNPYNDEIFRDFQSLERPTDLIFVGRLVSDKGVDVLIEALPILHESGISSQLTVAGEGLERALLEKQISRLGLESHVQFIGQQSSSELAKILNRHRILVVPSRWPEPFGIVALEAIACGCVAVGSAEGGLPEAIGPCGVIFPNGDPRALADVLARLLTDPARYDALRRGAAAHLARFTRRYVANLYLETMKTAR